MTTASLPSRIQSGWRTATRLDGWFHAGCGACRNRASLRRVLVEMEEELRELVERIRWGMPQESDRAFERVQSRYNLALRDYLRRTVVIWYRLSPEMQPRERAGAVRALVDEFLQETWVEVWRRCKGYARMKAGSICEEHDGDQHYVRAGDFSDLGAFAARLRDETIPLSAFLMSKLAPDTRHWLLAYNGETPTDKPQIAELVGRAKSLAKALNGILNSEDLGADGHCSDIPALVRALPHAEAGHDDHFRANYLLLEHAYPGLIATGYNPRWSFYTYVTQIARWIVREDVRRRSQHSQIDEETELASADEVDSLPATEGPEVRNEVQCQLFRMVFLCGGLPHQQLAFGYSKLIYGKMSKGDRGIEGNPKLVEEKHSNMDLGSMTRSFWTDYSSVSGFGTDKLKRLVDGLSPIKARLPLLPDVALDDATRGVFKGDTSQPISKSCLVHYYGERKGTASIANWCDAVRKRVRRVFVNGVKSCKVCHLPRIPHCEMPEAEGEA